MRHSGVVLVSRLLRYNVALILSLPAFHSHLHPNHQPSPYPNPNHKLTRALIGRPFVEAVVVVVALVISVLCTRRSNGYKTSLIDQYWQRKGVFWTNPDLGSLQPLCIYPSPDHPDPELNL